VLLEHRGHGTVIFTLFTIPSLARCRLPSNLIPHLGARQHVAHGHGVPLPAPRRLDPARVEDVRNLSQRSCPAFLISRISGSTLAAWLSAAAPMVSEATLHASATKHLLYRRKPHVACQSRLDARAANSASDHALHRKLSVCPHSCFNLCCQRPH
jgi:hypothetical protein